jgi:hypothetical protein
MRLDFDRQMEFLEQLAPGSRFNVFPRFNPTSRKTNQSRCANRHRSSDHQELIHFMQDPDHCMPTGILPLAKILTAHDR